MSTAWQGYYLDGRSATRQPVTIQISQHALHFTTSTGKTFRWPYADIRQTQGFYRDEQVRLERGGQLSEALTITDHAFLSALKKDAPELTVHLHDPARANRRTHLTVLAAIGTIGISTVLYLWGIPGLARVVTPLVPISWEQRLGMVVIDHLAPAKKRCTDSKRMAVIQRLVNRLAAHAPSNPYEIKLIVVNQGMINAFAAPGGYIVVFRGLLEHTERPEQLAGVLAHEFQHIYKRHTTSAVIQHSASSLLLAAVAGDFSGAMTYGIEAARTIGMLRYSRGFEREADTEGFRLLVRAGIDPAGMVEFFQMLQKKYPDMPGMLGYLSSHPNTQERITYLKTLVQTSPDAQSKPFPEIDWKETRNICKTKPTPPQPRP